MKSILTTLSIICASTMFSQSISNYQYIYVTKELDKKVDFPKVREALISSLTAKKYSIIQNDVNYWPTEITNNKCQVATAKLIDDSTFLRNRVKLQFNDCNGKLIDEVKGSSAEKDFELGLREALLNAMQNVATSKPTKTIETTLDEPIKAPEPVYVEGNTNVETPINTKNSYTNGQSDFNFITISKTQFILVNAGSDKAYATFTPSSLSNVYHVTLESGKQTIGYMEKNQIIIDLPTGSQEYKKEIFKKK